MQIGTFLKTLVTALGGGPVENSTIHLVLWVSVNPSHTRYFHLNISLFSCTPTASTTSLKMSGTMTPSPSTSTERLSRRTLSLSGEINATVTVTIVAIVASYQAWQPHLLQPGSGGACNSGILNVAN